MTQFWEFLLLGLGLCPAFALVGQSVVVVFRGSNVVNFAAAGFALLGAYAYYGATRIGAPPAVALVVGLAAGAGAGAATDAVIMRRLAGAPQLTRVIATLGLATLILVSVSLAAGDSSSPVPPKLFHDSHVTILGSTASGYNLGIFAISLGVTIAIWAFYRWTRFGLQTSAVAENQRAAAALGHSPARISRANWACGGVLAALGGILITPIIALNADAAETLLAPALAAALLGGFSSYWLSFLGALIIGVGESELTHYSSVWGLGSGWDVVAPFLLVVIVLVVRSSSLPERGHITQRLPGVGNGRVRPGLVALLLIVGAVVIALLPTAGAGAVTDTAGTAIILISFVVVTGYAGQISLAQAGLAGIGAFIAARLGGAIGLGFWLSALVGIAGTLPIGFIVGLPALRARGVNLAIVTLGLGLIIEDVILGNSSYVGGLEGLPVPNPSIFGFALDGFDHPARYATMGFVAFVVIGVLVANLRRGRLGRALIAARGNERAAASLGVNLTASKLYAFVLGSGIAAVGGILLAFQSPYALFSGFDTTTSIELLTFIVVGGLGFVGGTVFGGMLAGAGVAAWLVGLVITSSVIANWLSLFGGVAVIVAVIYQPDGIAALEARRWGPLLDRVGRPRIRRPSAVPLADERGAPAGRREPTRRVDAELVVSGITVRFGGVVALDDVSFAIRSGEVVGLIGPNGAGKTTMIDSITGQTRRYAGTVSLDGVAIDGWGPARRARAGIVRSFQSLELFDDLTVEDNLRVAAELVGPRNYLADLIRPTRPPLGGSAIAAVDEFELSDHLAKKPGDLPYGRRRLVAIARAVAASQASVLLLDEPAAGLDERSSRELSHLLRRLARDWNLAILLVEHDMSLVMSACDRIVALDFGRVIASGATEDIRNDAAVRDAYLGHADTSPERPTPSMASSRTVERA